LLTNTQTVRVFQQLADGNFSQVWEGLQPQDLLAEHGIMGVYSIAVEDLDGDGKRDLFVQWESTTNKALQILKNEGDFQFRDVSHDWLGSYIYRETTSSNLYTMADLRDVNRDGTLDIVLRNMGAEAPLVAAGDAAGAAIYLNDGT